MIPKVQIRLEKWVVAKDSHGNAVEQIGNAYNTWAQIVPQNGQRVNLSGQIQLSKSKQFKIRFRPDWVLDGNWKIIYLQTRYTITNIQRLNEKRYNWIINGEG